MNRDKGVSCNTNKDLLKYRPVMHLLQVFTPDIKSNVRLIFMYNYYLQMQLLLSATKSKIWRQSNLKCRFSFIDDFNLSSVTQKAAKQLLSWLIKARSSKYGLRNETIIILNSTFTLGFFSDCIDKNVHINKSILLFSSV